MVAKMLLLLGNTVAIFIRTASCRQPACSGQLLYNQKRFSCFQKISIAHCPPTLLPVRLWLTCGWVECVTSWLFVIIIKMPICFMGDKLSLPLPRSPFTQSLMLIFVLWCCCVPRIHPTSKTYPLLILLCSSLVYFSSPGQQARAV